jgi:hypothetical protein
VTDGEIALLREMSEAVEARAERTRYEMVLHFSFILGLISARLLPPALLLAVVLALEVKGAIYDDRQRKALRARLADIEEEL